MKQQWEVGASNRPDVDHLLRAVAYYRHSSQERQESLIAIQRDQVRQWAADSGIEIIREFEDAGKACLNAEDRPSFTEMMEEWVRKRADFNYILCLDFSRWGRFQDIGFSARFSVECHKHNKQVTYTVNGKPGEDILHHPV